MLFVLLNISSIVSTTGLIVTTLRLESANATAAHAAVAAHWAVAVHDRDVLIIERLLLVHHARMGLAADSTDWKNLLRVLVVLTEGVVASLKARPLAVRCGLLPNSTHASPIWGGYVVVRHNVEDARSTVQGRVVLRVGGSHA